MHTVANKTYIKYLLLHVILAISSYEYFFRVGHQAVYLLFPIALLLFILYKEKLDISVVKVILPFLGAYILQYLLYGTPLYFAATFAIRLFTVYLTVKIIGKDFIKIFINTIKVISIVAIFLFAIQQIPAGCKMLLMICDNFTSLGVTSEGIHGRPNFIIYAVQPLGVRGLSYFRNSGPFWEPGLYAVFLNIALFLNAFAERKITDKTSILFVISIISTVSTAGLIGLIIIVVLYNIESGNAPLLYRYSLICLLILSIPFILSLPFIGEKIAMQIDDSDISYSRFGAVVVHMNIIKDYPYAGLPYDDNETYSNYADNISPNGITEIFIRYGVFAGIFYYILLFRASNKIMKMLNYNNMGYALFMVFILMIFSQTMGNKPIYWAFVFVPYAIDSIRQTKAVGRRNVLK